MDHVALSKEIFGFICPREVIFYEITTFSNNGILSNSHYQFLLLRKLKSQSQDFLLAAEVKSAAATLDGKTTAWFHEVIGEYSKWVEMQPYLKIKSAFTRDLHLRFKKNKNHLLWLHQATIFQPWAAVNTMLAPFHSCSTTC